MSDLIREAVRQAQRVIAQDLGRIRASLGHSVNKGAHAEQAIRGFLDTHLPGRLHVGHGEVIDRTGRSGQLDVVVASNECPLFYPPHSPGLYIIEGVESVGEIKMSLKSTALDMAVTSASKFRSLTRQFPVFSTSSASKSTLERYTSKPPYCLVAYESELTLDSVVRRIPLDDKDRPVIDSVFLLNRGWAVNLGDGQEEFKILEPDGSSCTDWRVHENEDAAGECLFWLLSWLVIGLPRISVPRRVFGDYLWGSTPRGVQVTTRSSDTSKRGATANDSR